MVDGDDTYPAEEAHKLLAKLREAGGDTVVGCRVCAGRHGVQEHPPMGQPAPFPFDREIMFGVDCGDLFSGYRLFTRRFYRNIPLVATGFEVEAELAMQTIDKRFVQRNVDVAYRSRPADSFSKLQTLPDGTRVVWTLLLIIKDCKPLPFLQSARVRAIGNVPAGGSVSPSTITSLSATSTKSRSPSWRSAWG